MVEPTHTEAEAQPQWKPSHWLQRLASHTVRLCHHAGWGLQGTSPEHRGHHGHDCYFCSQDDSVAQLTEARAQALASPSAPTRIPLTHLGRTEGADTPPTPGMACWCCGDLPLALVRKYHSQLWLAPATAHLVSPTWSLPHCRAWHAQCTPRHATSCPAACLVVSADQLDQAPPQHTATAAQVQSQMQAWWLLCIDGEPKDPQWCEPERWLRSAWLPPHTPPEKLVMCAGHRLAQALLDFSLAHQRLLTWQELFRWLQKRPRTQCWFPPATLFAQQHAVLPWFL